MPCVTPYQSLLSPKLMFIFAYGMRLGFNMNRKAVLVLAIAAIMVASGFAILAYMPATQPTTSYKSGNTAVPLATSNSVAASGNSAVMSKDLNRVMNQAAYSGVPMKDLYLPNFHSATSMVNGHVTPGYVTSPAPMGIGDYGLMNKSGSLSTYNYTTSSFEASINLTSFSDLNMASDAPQSVTFQLNSVLNNTDLFGLPAYAMWTQNVLFYSARTHQATFIDNIWNFSSPATYLTNNAINYSRQPGGLLFNYPGVHIAEGPTIQLHYPFTVNLYINTSVTDRESTVWFNYSVTHATNLTGSPVHHGYYDMVEFNSTYNQPSTYKAPAPTFLVSGTQITPTGFIPYDAEIMVGGPGGGSTATIYNINGTMNLDFYNATAHGYQPVKAAYSIGSETGETSTGVDVSYSGTTAYLNPGPSMVYGLWNNNPVGQTTYAVSSGNSVAPYVFINNNVTLININANNWAPMPNLVNNFRLPTGHYIYQAQLNYHDPSIGTLLPTTTITLTKDMSAGVYTPITIMNNAQLAAQALSGSGTAASPYVINARAVNTGMSPLFGQLNDYLFPVFEGVIIMNTTDHFILNNTYMPIQYTGVSAFYVNFFNSLGYPLPLTNQLTTSLYDVSNATVMNGMFGSWYSFEQAGFVEGSLVFWNTTNSVVENSQFTSYGDAFVIYNAPTQVGNNTVFNNDFYGTSYLSGIGPQFDVASIIYLDGAFQNGIDMYSGGNLVYGNSFLTQNPANDNLYNFYMGTLAPSYINSWNNTTMGNYWWNYDGVGSYNNSGQLFGQADMQPMVMPGAVNVNVVKMPGVTLAAFSYDGFDYYGNISAPEFTLYQVVPNLGNTMDYLYFTVSGTGEQFVQGTTYISSTLGLGNSAMAPAYTMSFTETGLSSGTMWSVTANGVSLSGTSSVLSMWVFSGAYTYVVGSVKGFSSSPTSGTVSVGSSASNTAIAFTANKVSLTFKETGLPSGTNWTIVVNGQSYSHNTSSIVVSGSPGKFTFSIANISGYTSSISSGSVNVDANSTISVHFSSSSSSAAGASSTTVIEYVVASVVGGLVIGGVVTWILVGRKGAPAP